MVGRKKGTPKTGGRQPGSQNRTTKEARQLLEGILFGQIENIQIALDEIRKSDPAKYIDACSKMFSFVLPKKTDITTDDKPIRLPYDFSELTSEEIAEMDRIADKAVRNE